MQERNLEQSADAALVQPTFSSAADVQQQAERMREYFVSGATRDITHRKQALRTMKAWLKSHEVEVLQALHTDLGKSAYEGYITELGLVYEEIDTMLKHLAEWSKPYTVSSPMPVFPATSTVVPSPYGVVLVLSPWNYPLQLALVPMVDAIAAGNCVAFKPARESAATSALLVRMAAEAFDSRFICGIPGSAGANEWIGQTQWDYIMFTGSPSVGKLIMTHAAQFLTPVTLELGGKSPCIVTEDAKLDVAAKRIAWGKGINCGQTCVAPDYLLVHESVARELAERIAHYWQQFYGVNALESDIWPHMISEKHFDRVMGLIEQHNPKAQVFCGGKGDKATLKIQPTIMTGVTLDDPVMGEEIFGPVLPMITYSTLDEAFAIVRKMPHPLACYVFTESKTTKQRVVNELQFGGATINDVCLHLTNNNMGFGGLGNSGMGAYHGKVGFDTFTHYKSTLDHGTWVDPDVRYPPFTPQKKQLARTLMS
ncbi:aldehyde dehydrogenase [Bifidobacterium dolichotidis]|uniref:Aldehyde dehydrogenase n=1 Tax=Bifidobacterium dolichotidis TaxID=2306976 RepID=A0A430FRX2_9BIFI|nr:aldehyde dehydrogenase family protein [Bifidobacterium dolichotidis]RSX55632.1 aldehyde dehydrogenase [Bifidobacterium dolichotidis]